MTEQQVIAHQAVPASTQAYVLGEGPVWDGPRQRVLWVDITAGLVLIGRLSADLTVVETQRLAFPGTVGVVVCSEAGDLLVAGPKQLRTVSAAGTVGPAPNWPPALIPDSKHSRLNDGGCDPAGRFLVGTLALDERTGDEQLLRVETSGAVTVLDAELGLSNGLAFSPDGTEFYSTDTLPGLIHARSYDAESGQYGSRRVLLKIDYGSPDGICVDADGNLWVAIWGAGQVRCFSPAGDLLATVEVDAPHTSCVAFVGPDLDTLLITTASEQLSPAQLAEHPDSGKLFTCRPGVRGLPVPAWSGP